ncbi:MAG: hypothetical protein O3A51_03040 [Verrucomicrobia bacterium]|nr:hypothetical protein [Verrucomicrobiota bacterium]
MTITALYREHETAGGASGELAGRGIGYPYVLRFVELEGVATEATLDLRGWELGLCTDLLGEQTVAVSVTSLAGSGSGTPQSRLRVALRPHEIATLYVDLAQGRKVYRDLESRRAGWVGGETYDR